VLQTIDGFHLEPTNICTLKCAGCARTRFLDKWPEHWKNHSLDIDLVLKFLDIDLSGKQINLCGNYGDPIYHSDLINFVSKLKQAGARIKITTNGSYKSRDWWQELTLHLDSQDTVRFSIDGVPNNFTQYRKNADWPSTLTAIETCVASSCQTVWKYIPFSYNQHSVEQAKKMCQDLGMDTFLLDPSDRFDEQTTDLLPKPNDLIGQRFVAQTKWKNGEQENIVAGLNPRCHTGREHFITADGYYSPCCYVADHRFYYKNQFGKNKKFYDIRQTTLSQLLAESAVLDFYKTLPQHDVCQFNCPNTESSV
jgi:MoaA/NifB/PqqE/SkfB family radical SAM enzyme